MALAFPILFVVEARPEDAVMASGLIRLLHDEVPGARFTVVGGPESAPLFRDTPRLDALHVLKGEGFDDLYGLWRKVRGRRWGLVVDLRGTRLSGFLSRKKRAVRAERAPDAPKVHKVIASAQVMRLDGAPRPYLFVSPETQKIADALVRPDDRPIVAVGPGTDWIGKLWPAERFAKTAAALLGADGPAPNGRLLIVGGDSERDDAQTIRFAVTRDRVIEAQGRLDFLQTCAALRRARLYVGTDSVWTHLAAAAGVPTLGLFGPTDDALEAPWSPVAKVVRTPRTLEDFRQVDPGLNQAINHMLDLRVDPVVRAAKRLWAETEPEPERVVADA
jgi:ADP-heptose:LPS heptosyltransferase